MNIITIIAVVYALMGAIVWGIHFYKTRKEKLGTFYRTTHLFSSLVFWPLMVLFGYLVFYRGMKNG